jgi:hypothetical protein
MHDHACLHGRHGVSRQLLLASDITWHHRYVRTLQKNRAGQ